MSFVADVTVSMPLLEQAHEAVPGAIGTLADYHRIGDASGAGRYVLFLWVTECDFDAWEDAMAADDTVESFEAITDSGARRLYQVRSEPFLAEEFQLSVFLRDRGIALYETKRDREGLHLRGQFPTRESLHALKRALEADGGWFRLNSVYAEDATGLRGQELTDRQREVLRTAAKYGYFETPSEATLSEIAAEFGVSPQAISKHIRTAVQKLVDGALDPDESGF